MTAEVFAWTMFIAIWLGLAIAITGLVNLARWWYSR